MTTNAADDAVLTRACEPRVIVNVSFDDDGTQGWVLRLKCGHEFWIAVPPVWQPMPCAECINQAVDAIRAARRSEG